MVDCICAVTKIILQLPGLTSVMAEYAELDNIVVL